MKKTLIALLTLICFICILQVSSVVSAKESQMTTQQFFPSVEGKRKEELKISMDNLKEFRQKQLEEYKAKAKEIQAKRKECLGKVNELNKQRVTDRKDVMKQFCVRSSKDASSSAKYDPKKCTEELRTFAKETQAKILEIRKSCFNEERQVLGLSTEVPATY
jgi:hypothetical protein